ncbi:hypothetical protein SSAG_00359 [Streptomyces sp. Mg1]|nr:hypothetical protein SSAG_00359 [Streptomyces sp. Mg1]
MAHRIGDHSVREKSVGLLTEPRPSLPPPSRPAWRVRRDVLDWFFWWYLCAMELTSRLTASRRNA